MAKVVAGGVIVHVVFKVVLGGLGALITAVVSLAIGVSTAGRAIRCLRLLGSRVAGLRRRLLLVGVGRSSILLARRRGRHIEARGSVLLARCSVLGAGTLRLRSTIVGGGTRLVGCGTLDGSRWNTIGSGWGQVLAGRRRILTRRKVRAGHWRFSGGQQNAGEGGDNGKQLGKSGMAHVIKTFSWGRVIEGTIVVCKCVGTRATRWVSNDINSSGDKTTTTIKSGGDDLDKLNCVRDCGFNANLIAPLRDFSTD